MDQNQLKITIEKILSKPSYQFHRFDEAKMAICESQEANPTTAYYHRREKVDIMNDLFEEEIQYIFDQDSGEINIKQ